MRSAEVVKRLRKAGWVDIRQSGSHKQFRHPTRPGTVTVPHPKAEMAIGTLKSIEKQSGVTLQ
ncbi:MAG: type II toxin-antitoxin system HicA family toxin [Sphingomonas sp.]|nr:MAG: type II toxin-antitoxin system HicA family toxin [Sphingomonas sp.]